MRCLLLLPLLMCLGCESVPSFKNDELSAYARDSTGRFRKEVDSLEKVKTKNVVTQDHEYTCGAAALATIMQYYFDDDVSEKDILDIIERQLSKADWVEKFASGLSFQDLINAAKSKQLGYEAEARELKITDLIKLTAPVIVPIETETFSHFVVYRGIIDDRVYLADPIAGNIRMPIDKFREQWTGAALALSKEDIEPSDDHALAIDKSATSRPELQSARRHLSQF